jgi:uncharacterized membrane protein
MSFVFIFVFVNFFGHVRSSHHSEQMSQRSQVSRITLRRCSQNVFFFVFVFLFVFVIFLVKSCLHYDQMYQSSQDSRVTL